ncbi:MAG: 6-phosphogluconolactonase [bacterium]
MEQEIDIYPSKPALVTMAAEKIVEIINLSRQRWGDCSVALAGGNTPRDVYSLLASRLYQNRVDWPQVHLFWGDERAVPPDHPDSNFRMVKESLLDQIEIPPANVHRMRGEIEPEQAALEYEQVLLEQFNESPPRFDLILLGLGEDGHTASLFPGAKAIDEKNKLVTSVFVSRLDTNRITLTLPVLNAARTVIFLVAGSSKSEIVQRVLNLDGPSKQLPASLVLPVPGNLMWMLDNSAAALLFEKTRQS